jgi:asparagine synthase (glutamine-hydrolysing)
MCGFVVVCQEKIEKNSMEAALKSLKHRGPDEMSVWQNDKKDITFGHTRLSIIDLAGGLQPLTNHDQSLVAVVNGEFYDYQKIYQELKNDGYKFKSSSDSEILLGLYERYGTQCLKFLRGEFAFVLYDHKNRLVFSARDRFGIKPLFYMQNKKAIYFASEAKAFKALGVRLSFDEDNFFQTMSMFPLPSGSLFSGVEQIPPAHSLVKSEFGTTVHKQSYWDFNYPKAPNDKKDDGDVIAGLHDIFKESVNLRLKADVDVGCYLSGGLDSCAVLGFAQSMSKKPVQSFTLTFDGEDYNERDQAEEMARFCGAEFNPIAISQADIADGFEDTVWHAERPIINGHAVAKYLLSKAVNKLGLKVVLTGEGSDEIFGGYAHFRQDAIASDFKFSESEKEKLFGDLEKSNRVSSGLLLSGKAETVNRLVEAQVGFMPHWMRGFFAHSSILQEIFSDDFKNQYSGRNPQSYVLNFLDIAGQVQNRDPLSASLYLWSRTMLPYYLLTVLGDRMEMAHSIEGRLPFLDHKVVEYVVGMPNHLKINGLTEKYGLREASKPYITKTIYERQKHPFIAPPALMDKDRAMATLIEDTLRGQELSKISFLDQRKVIAMLDNFKSFSDAEKAKCDFVFMAITSACLIQKLFELSC